ncbi:hypothetical protein [Curtobacterium sp. Leaf261]|uniref:hypothetical protein n=1 Tax=Curtobacterium sp. Leaf261 TaxID=1736311 RepID=UPI0006FB0398|nr:hypothetical protein [Curtobacterium sp. Leaf261]KQO60307.1 hypothetical protein ASF23_13835 [Curtobacterium sp. Leaf261]
MTANGPVPQALRNRAFDTTTARRFGMTRTQLGSPLLEAPHHGVRVPAGTSDSIPGRARGLVPALGPHRYFSSVTALAIWGAPLPRRLTENGPLHVTSIRPTIRTRRPGVVGHTSGPVTILMRGGLPVESAELAWLHAARELSVRELVVAGDALVGNGTGTVTDLVRLRTVVTEAAGARGVERARDAVGLVRAGSESPKETEARLWLPAALAQEVELNVEVYDRGVFLGRPDLVFVRAMVTLEYEGDHHRTDRRVFRNDIARRRGFEDAGWRVFQMTQDDLARRSDTVRRRLSDVVDSRVGRGDHLEERRRNGRLVAIRS